MRGALLTGAAEPLEVVDDLDIERPRPDEVLVRVEACGICHSDVTVQQGGYAVPAVLGHEAAGVVEAVGAGVVHLREGDPVVLTPLAPCGHCPACARHEATACPDALSFSASTRPDGTTPISRRGAAVHRGLGVGGFAELACVPATGAVRIDRDIPLDVACVVGCAMQTGVGAVLNTATVEPGASVLVTGLGGIGQAIVQGASVAGATRIIVSDPVEARREHATRFGATDVIDPTRDDLVAAVAELTAGAGVDYAFEAAGRTDLVEQGIAATRVGGTTVMVGASPVDASVTIDAAVLFMTMQKRLVGSLLGGCWPDRDIPLILDLWRFGKLDLEAMITHRVPVEEINDGIDRLGAAEGIRTVVQIAG